jgi:uncharacterized protein
MAHIKVGKSAIEGLGVFAERAVAAGSLIAVLDTSRAVDDEHPLRPEMGETQDHCTYLANGMVVLLPAPERHLNHSCDPNAFLKTVDGELRLLARRAIQPGEEVTLDYIMNTDGGARWLCRCGSPQCRGLLEAMWVPEIMPL